MNYYRIQFNKHKDNNTTTTTTATNLNFRLPYNFMKQINFNDDKRKKNEIRSKEDNTKIKEIKKFK